MKQRILLLMIGLLLVLPLISSTEISNNEKLELNFFEKIINWFKTIFSSDKNNTVLSDFDGNVEFHKSMSCGCCGAHSSYIKRQGLDHRIINMDDVSPIKDTLGVPDGLRSCHTVILGDYFVEGHMPVEAIEKLITEKPDIAGIALPGMPSGSPGMPGTKTETWIIYAVNHDGTSHEFMRI